MRVLGIETSGSVGGFAVVDDGRLVAETVSDVTGHHLEKGAAMIEYVLRSAAMTIDDLDGVAVSVGPGSFTGLRVGLALAKGICFGSEIPLAGVPTLDCIAEAFAYTDAFVVPVKDARRGEIYLSFYEARRGVITRFGDYRALSPDLLAEELKGDSAPFSGDRTILLVGDALVKYGEVLRSRLGGRVMMAPQAFWGARPALVAGIGVRLLREGKIADLDTVEPMYVRLSEAERKPAGLVGRGTDKNKKNDGR